MGVIALNFYQGEDWFTYRWSVAQAFETLERLFDLCSHQSAEQESPVSEGEGVFCSVGDLCDDLAAELAAVEADLQPFLRNNLQQRWQSFEMRLYMDELLRLLAAATPEDRHRLFERVLSYARHIKEILKQLDQCPPPS